MIAKNREWILAVAAGACIGAWVADNFILTPLTNLWQNRSERISELRKQLASGELLVQRETANRERWNEMRKNTFSAEVSEAEDRILKSANRWAQESGLGLSSLKPRVTQETEEFQKAEFSASGQGSIESVARFLYELECDDLPLKVEQVQISTHDKTGKELSLEVRFSGLLMAAEKI
jgi:hypothetical protein